MTQMFNAEQFLNAGTDQAMETRRTPVPPKEYVAIVDEIKPKMVKESVAVDVFWAVDDSALAEQMGLKKVTVRQTVFLDIDANGKLETGPNKNVQLGRVREALGQNKAGAWTIGMLKGAGPAKILVDNQPDKDDPTIVYDVVKAVTKMAA